ncbi:MAG: putative Ig domain-containing protein [Clostridiaceae bacterium]|nr:putative Ig domain-containing protein [Clostridiaceae bacterium]
MKSNKSLSWILIIVIILSLFTEMPVTANEVSGELLRITTMDLPYPTVSQEYSSPSMTAAGGTAPYTWSAAGLPLGLNIDVYSGVISGIPAPGRYGTYYVAVTVMDANNMTLTKNFGIDLLSANPSLFITTTSLPYATINYNYSSPGMLAAGGTAPYTWSAAGLPLGLSIDPYSGVISGMPDSRASGPHSVTITVIDTYNATASKTLTLTLLDDYVRIITDGMDRPTLPSGMVGEPYRITLVADYGKKPYSWSATSLPDGLTIDADNGTISGIPTTAIAYTYVKVTVKQVDNVSNTVLFYFVIDPAQQYSVTYDANGATDGTAPTDSSSYVQGDNAAVLDNSGNLSRTGYTFNGWNTASDGTGIHYAADGSASISIGTSNVLLYAEWLLQINNQPAPTGLTGEAPSAYGASDGKIIGTTTDMEYKLPADSIYTAAAGTEITGLTAGTYDVRFAARTGFNASPDTVVTVPDGPVIKVSSIVVTGTNGSTNVTLNGSLQMIAIISPLNATNQTVTWRVKNGTGRAIINSDGLLTGIKTGNVSVIAAAADGSGVIGTGTINIIIPVTKITVAGTNRSSSIAVNNSLQMIASITPNNATNKTVTWCVINETGSATITSSGLLTAASAGTVTVIASANDGSGVIGSAKIDIIILITEISVSGSDHTTDVTLKGTLQMVATLSPTDATNKSVTWKVINRTGKATISPTGLLTGLKTGTVTVVAIANDGSGIKGSLVINVVAGQ